MGILGAAPAPGPQETVRVVLTRAGAIVTGGGSHDERLASLKSLTRDLLDTDTMGRRAMGPVLASRPEAEQAEFLELFEELIVRAYLQKLLFFRNPEFVYGDETIEGGTATVNTRIRTSRDDFYVDYELRLRGSEWVATDVIVEHASLTRNYHRQFARLLEAESFEELLDRLRGKLRHLRDDSE